MTETQKELERLRTLQEFCNELADKVEVQLPAIADKIDNIKLPDIDTTELAKETTLNAVSSKLDNINVEVDLSSVAKQGENQEATNSKMYETLNELPNRILDIIESKTTFPVNYDGAVCPYPINSIISAIDNRDNITELTDDKTFELTKNWTQYGLPNVTILTLNILGKVVRRGFGNSSIKELYLPAFKYSDVGISQVFASANNLIKLSIPNATGFTGNYEFSSPYLIDLEIGKAFNSSQDFGAGEYGWNPIIAMSDASDMVEDTVDEFGRAIVTNKDQLLYNIRRHFAANLRELTNGEGYYIALGPIKDIIIDDEPTYSAFTNKGWTLA